MSKPFLLMTSILICVGCQTMPSYNEAELDRKIQEEKPANTPEDIVQRAADVFSSAPNLTEDQRIRLNRLYLKTYADSMQIRKEIGQMKSLLFKEAAIKKFKTGDVNQLTQRIVAADNRRLNIMFKALEEMQSIVGYGEDKQELYEYLRNYEIPGNASR
ncbi:hypothetical protein AZI87_01570 [Bdellovibrio bacteriovorus]|uniref:Uncharacterized protein n=1 Tax=Bdellovibrio bacteriovorus TaxID=959 RepID=A0A161PT88_BDEBC|nr:hypothetical protein [Bdellovibrio bacteriovorus]KYG67986.1 hypothetical protein AZI87_01570 [Bdellovibrio bacteriovorus]